MQKVMHVFFLLLVTVTLSALPSQVTANYSSSEWSCLSKKVHPRFGYRAVPKNAASQSMSTPITTFRGCLDFQLYTNKESGNINLCIDRCKQAPDGQSCSSKAIKDIKRLLEKRAKQKYNANKYTHTIQLFVKTKNTRTKNGWVPFEEFEKVAGCPVPYDQCSLEAYGKQLKEEQQQETQKETTPSSTPTSLMRQLLYAITQVFDDRSKNTSRLAAASGAIVSPFDVGCDKDTDPTTPVKPTPPTNTGTGVGATEAGTGVVSGTGGAEVDEAGSAGSKETQPPFFKPPTSAAGGAPKQGADGVPAAQGDSGGADAGGAGAEQIPTSPATGEVAKTPATVSAAPQPTPKPTASQTTDKPPVSPATETAHRPQLEAPEQKSETTQAPWQQSTEPQPQPPAATQPDNTSPLSSFLGAFYDAIAPQSSAPATTSALLAQDRGYNPLTRFLAANDTETTRFAPAISSPEAAANDPLRERIAAQNKRIAQLDQRLKKEREALGTLPKTTTTESGLRIEVATSTEQTTQWLERILKDKKQLNRRIKAIIEKSGYYGYVQTDHAIEVYEKTGEKLLAVTTDENGRTQVGLVNKDGKVVFAPKGGLLEDPAAWSEFTDAFVYIAGREPEAVVQGADDVFTPYPFEIALRELYGPEAVQAGIALDPENPFMTLGRDGMRIPLSVFEAAQLAAEEARGIRRQKQEIAEMTGETISIITTSETLRAAKIDPALLPQMRIPTISQEARYLAELKKELAKRGHIRLTERFKVALFNRYDTTLKKVSGLVAFTIRIDANGNPITNETKTGFAIADVISGIFAEAATALTDKNTDESPLVRFFKLFITPPRPENAGGVIRLSDTDALPATEPRSASEALLRILTAPLHFVAQLLGR